MSTFVMIPPLHFNLLMRDLLCYAFEIFCRSRGNLLVLFKLVALRVSGKRHTNRQAVVVSVTISEPRNSVLVSSSRQSVMAEKEWY